jgi:hypothetical protein
MASDMRRTLVLGVSLTLLALAGCKGKDAASSSAAAASGFSADAVAQAPQYPPMEGRPTTEAWTVSGGQGAYGMPRAPMPYDQLGAFERQVQDTSGPSDEASDNGDQDQREQPDRSDRHGKRQAKSGGAVFY